MDGIVDKLEEKLGGDVVHLIFHEFAGITRDVVEDLEFFINMKYRGRISIRLKP